MHTRWLCGEKTSGYKQHMNCRNEKECDAERDIYFTKILKYAKQNSTAIQSVHFSLMGTPEGCWMQIIGNGC